MLMHSHILVLDISTPLQKSNLVKSLTDGLDESQTIFNALDRYNPYAPGNQSQLQLPLSIEDSATDEYGQIHKNYLDEIFGYVSLGTIDKEEKIIDAVDGTPQLSDNIKVFLAQSYYADQDTDDKIKFYKECKDDEDEGETCAKELAKYEKIRDEYFSKGFDR